MLMHIIRMISTMVLLLVFGATALAATTNYTYDDLYRLTMVSRSDGTVIEYRYDEAGNRTRKIVQGVIDTTPPTPNPMTFASPPAATSSTAITMTATTATDAVSPPVSYYFNFVTSPTGGTGGTDSPVQPGIGYTNSGLQPNHQYGYWVMARDAAATPNPTGYSATVNRYTLANAPVAAAFSNITQAGIRANWTANGSRTGTEYYCENITAGTNSGWTPNAYWDSGGLTSGTSYTFRVQARNGDGIPTGWTSLGSQSTLNCSTPSIPGNSNPADGATGVSTSPTLSWTASGADSYDIYYGTTSNPPLVATGNSNIFTVPVLSSNTTYYWKILAKNSCGQSTPGPVWSFTTVCAAPSIPSSPSPSNGATGISTSPTLTWTASGANSYDVYFGTAANPPLVTNTANTNYHPTGLTGGATYYWKIVAKNTCGQSTAGPVWSFTADATGVTIPFTVLLDGSPFAGMEWGWKTSATDNYDNGIDTLAPQPPFDGDDAYFFSIIGQTAPLDKLRKDFRAVGNEAKTWKLVLKVADGKTLKLQWDPLALPAGWTFTIQEANSSWVATGPSVINLNSSPPELNLANQTGDLMTKRYLVRAFMGYPLSLKSGGWNLISLPMEPVDPIPSNLFGTNLLSIYEWDAAGKQYKVPAALQAKKGYWVAVGQDANLEVIGVPPQSGSVHLLPGWNLVGPVDTVAYPSGPPVLAVYGWGWPPSYQYVLPVQCEEGKGYWIAVSQEGDVW